MTLPPFADECLRGIGQVVFCNSAKSGGVILAAMTAGDPLLGALGALGAVTATATARAGGFDRGAVADGLFGYNGALVGCALSAFLGADAAVTAGCTALGAAATVPLASVLKRAVAPVPQWTLAFNAVTLGALAFARPLIGAPDAPAVATDTAAIGNLLDWAAAPLVSVSQIFVVEDPLAGALMLAGMALYSPQCALYTIAGANVGIFTGYMAGAPEVELTAGLYGFNSALSALAVGVFFKPNAAAGVLALTSAGAAAVLFGATKGAMASAFGLPVLTLPFCAMASLCYLAPRLGASALELAAEPHSPEENAKELKK